MPLQAGEHSTMTNGQPNMETNNLDGSLRELRASLKQFNGQTLPEVKVALDEVHKTLRTANSAISLLPRSRPRQRSREAFKSFRPLYKPA